MMTRFDPLGQGAGAAWSQRALPIYRGRLPVHAEHGRQITGGDRGRELRQARCREHGDVRDMIGSISRGERA